MPIHDWTRVDAGIFHAFHHGWIEEIARALNRGLLPGDYYALPEQHASSFGPDVLALELTRNEFDDSDETDMARPSSNGGGVALAAPKIQFVAETDMAFYRRKQNSIAVRHVSGDRLVAMVEIVSLGNKAGRKAMQAFVGKAAALIEQQIHLLVLDLHPPSRRDPQGIHGEIWEEIAGQEYAAPKEKPLTLAAYEAALSVRAYVVHAAVGDELADMPLFLEPDRAVNVPLDATYQAAFVELPARWKRVLEVASKER